MTVRSRPGLSESTHVHPSPPGRAVSAVSLGALGWAVSCSARSLARASPRRDATLSARPRMCPGPPARTAPEYSSSEAARSPQPRRDTTPAWHTPSNPRFFLILVVVAIARLRSRLYIAARRGNSSTASACLALAGTSRWRAGESIAGDPVPPPLRRGPPRGGERGCSGTGSRTG